MQELMVFHPVSVGLISQVRLNRAIRRLWARREGHNHLG